MVFQYSKLQIGASKINNKTFIIILLFYRVSSLFAFIYIIKVERFGFWFAWKVSAQSKSSELLKK